MSDLQRLRQEIDILDQDLLGLIAKRVMIVQQIGAYKKAEGLSILNEERKQAVLESWQQQAEQLGLSQKYVKKLYDVIHEYSVEIEANRETK